MDKAGNREPKRQSPTAWRTEFRTVSRYIDARRTKRIVTATGLSLAPDWTTERLAGELDEAAQRTLDHFHWWSNEPEPAATQRQLEAIRAGADRLLKLMGMPRGDKIELPERRLPDALLAGVSGGWPDYADEHWREIVLRHCGVADGDILKLLPRLVVSLQVLAVAADRGAARHGSGKSKGHDRHRGDDAVNALLRRGCGIFERAFGRKPAASLPSDPQNAQGFTAGPTVRFCQALVVELGKALQAEPGRRRQRGKLALAAEREEAARDSRVSVRFRAMSRRELDAAFAVPDAQKETALAAEFAVLNDVAIAARLRRILKRAKRR